MSALTPCLKRHGLSKMSVSLLETVVGLSLLVTILIGTAKLIVSIQRTTIFSNELNVATNAAAEQVELVKTLTINELITLKDDSNFNQFSAQRVVDGKIRALKAIPGQQLPGSIKIEGVAGGKLMRIIVSVNWQSAIGPGKFTLIWTREVVGGN